ncbi:2-hydroxy fatty acid dioxygenase [Marchantia polymorpha subsp. ruderalis]|uniref:Uncharacterized protein n=2 Tax=Marchantia polymorpha TaxID=3197 RepID=A0AAF6BNN1_MARPO|nr:hypothetical protein MARPO_0034s0023 [Marchantia polymorpha]BBN13615.1 hypothetical protein Mp_6g04950 [Marchantia polymorpha subsp. ruderalis]|eukprot:PTQ41417.1 hypothetical protein MARPO_0034s0023 [Marchantia polymorpha]
MGAPHTLTCAPAAPTLVRAGRRISCLTRAERAEFGASSSVRARLGLWRSSVVHRGRGRGRPIVGVDGQFRAWAVNGSRDVEGGETAGRGDCGEEEKAVARARAGEREEELLIGNMADLLNLEKQFAFYGAYHSNKLNVLVHMFFVWPIFFTSGILWAYTPAIIPLPLPAGTLPFQQYMILNVNFVIAGIYALYYAALDKKAGSLGAAICLGCWIGSQAIAESLPWSTAWKVVLLSQVTCWTFQILGHAVFEGRAPALLDNLPQAFLMAPFFVLLEFLQSFFGYEPYPGFRQAVEKKTEENIAIWKAEKGKKAA